MEQVILKGTDLKVSQFCLGTWNFNDGKGDSQWPAQASEVSKAIVDKCLELGINFFDTAEGYSNSEKVLGRALLGRRQDAVISTKYGFRQGADTPPYSAQEIDDAITKALQNLQTTYIDIIQMHFPTYVKDAKETIQELERQKALGRIRYYGMSNFGPQKIKDFIEAGGKPVVNQVGYNLLWRSPEQGVIPECLKHGVDVLAYSPLQQGLLTGKYAQLSDVPEGRRRGKLFSKDSTPLSRHGQDGAEEEVDQALKKIHEICKTAGVEMSKAALSWILQQEGVAVVIAGASSPEQVEQNSQVIKLNNDVVRQLTEATEDVKAKIGLTLDQWSAVDRCQ
ncbi:1-deoxyxylulose-5-phosphate synthase YajO-like [Physella acuta]|uniref:1-deoxyxylulose-5-phosphate synthase YajO-like n=1 Tax=Physella acuta TaxID=109671 RepID=UPI0027DBA80A|nr:1-deoxyxylulose-5-phosphate synthase YajO-like [Physella acuta]